MRTFWYLSTFFLLSFHSVHGGSVSSAPVASLSAASSAPSLIPSTSYQPVGSPSDSGYALTLPSRSLEEWRLADFLLVTSIDGSLQARDRKTGVPIWTVSSNSPLTVVNDLEREKRAGQRDVGSVLSNGVTWIVEPLGDGRLYYFTQDTQLQRLPVTIKQLVNESPFALNGDDKIYTGSRQTTLFEIDALSGQIMHVYGQGSYGECKAMASSSEFFDLGDLDGSSRGRHPRSFLIGRTDYSLEIHVRNETIWNVTFSTWGPNNKDIDLASQHVYSPDNLYVTPIHNSSILALSTDSHKPAKWVGSVPSTAVSIFDVLTTDNESQSLMVLAQPPYPGKFPASALEGTYVQQTNDGQWYALSGVHHPSLVNSAPKARWYSHADERHLESSLVGAHYGVNKFDHEQASSEKDKQLIGSDNGGDPHSPAIYTPPSHGRVDYPSVWNNQPSQAATTTKKTTHWLVTWILDKLFTAIIILVFLAVAINMDWVQRVVSPAQRNMQAGAPANQLLEQAVKKVTIVEPSRLTAESEDALDSIEPTTDTDEKSEPVKVKMPSLENMNIADGVEPETALNEKPSFITEYNGDVTSANDDAQADLANDGLQTGEKKQRRKRGTRGGKKQREYKERLAAERQAVNEDGASEGEPQKEQDAQSPNTMPFVASGSSPSEDTIMDQLAPQHQLSSSTSLNSLHATYSPQGLPPNSYAPAPFTWTQDVLGMGSHGTVVYKGMFDFREVAVKRMLLNFYDLTQEDKLLQMSDGHRNVIRYYGKYQSGEFLYIALELCVGTLEDIVERSEKFEGLFAMPVAALILQQITLGLQYLHSLNIVHRDIKPQNILVAQPKELHKKQDSVRMVISDFGLGKKLDMNQSSFGATNTQPAGTAGWIAPELFSGTPRRLTKSIDIFSLGCVFYYVLTKGSHPFGRHFSRVDNITNNRCDLSGLCPGIDSFEEAKDLITKMVARDPADRPNVDEVLIHPFFWNKKERLDFLLKFSDRIEPEVRDPPSPLLQRLEEGAANIIGDDFKTRLSPELVANLDKFRKYNGHLVRDLLRAFRNKYHHWNEIEPPALKEEMSPLPDGYLNYFATRYPRLLMHIYYIVKENLAEESAFENFFIL